METDPWICYTNWKNFWLIRKFLFNKSCSQGSLCIIFQFWDQCLKIYKKFRKMGKNSQIFEKKFGSNCFQIKYYVNWTFWTTFILLNFFAYGVKILRLCYCQSTKYERFFSFYPFWKPLTKPKSNFYASKLDIFSGKIISLRHIPVSSKKLYISQNTKKRISTYW